MSYLIRPIENADNAAMAAVIRQVMPEYGASGPGFAIHDPEVDFMAEAYARPRCRYWVVVMDGQVMGGGGIAPLEGAGPGICELRKMYLRPEARGLGAGRELMIRALAFAKEAGFSQCYLETLKTMGEANLLYRKFGFKPLAGPLGNTGHFSCDTQYIKDL